MKQKTWISLKKAYATEHKIAGVLKSSVNTEYDDIINRIGQRVYRAPIEGRFFGLIILSKLLKNHV